jgi:hypothetical protein
MVGEGDPGEVVRIFREGLMEEGAGMARPDLDAEPSAAPPIAVSIDTPDAERPVRLTGVTHSYAAAAERRYLHTGEDLIVNVDFYANTASDDVVFSFDLVNDDNVVLMHTDTAIMGSRIDVPAGPGTVQIRLKDIPLLDGNFAYAVGIQSRGGVLYDSQDPAGAFEMMSPGKTTGAIYVTAEATLLSGQESAAALIPQQAS